MKKMIFILTGLAMSFICQAQIIVAKPFTISFEISAIEDDTRAYLLYQTDGRKFIDSSDIRKGFLTFSGTVNRLIPATVVFDHQKLGLKKLLQAGPSDIDYLKIYLCPGTSEAKAANRIQNAVFTNTGVNVDYAALKKAQKEIDDQWAVVSQSLVKATNADSIKILRNKYDSLGLARIPVLEKFIKQHSNSLVAIIAWEEWKAFKQRENPTSTEGIKNMFGILSSDVRSSEEASQARLFFTNNMRLKPGQPAPDFVQPDKSGKNIHLTDFKGNYVLVDLWASWCGPCRANHPALVKLYDEFKGRNFTILGVSLDEQDGRKKWLEAIKKDGLQWPQVSDLKHWDNAVVKLFSVPAVPFSLLVDPDGKILQIGGSVDDVRKTLLEAMGELN